MSDKIRVKVIHREHKDKLGTLIGMLWTANVAQVKLDDGEEIVCKPIEMTTIK